MVRFCPDFGQFWPKLSRFWPKLSLFWPKSPLWCTAKYLPLVVYTLPLVVYTLPMVVQCTPLYQCGFGHFEQNRPFLVHGPNKPQFGVKKHFFWCKNHFFGAKPTFLWTRDQRIRDKTAENGRFSAVLLKTMHFRHQIWWFCGKIAIFFVINPLGVEGVWGRLLPHVPDTGQTGRWKPRMCV